MTESTRSAIFGLFVLAGRDLSARELVALAAPLGVTATNLKSHLTRMVADGALSRAGPVRSARYRPAKEQIAVVQGISARLRAERNAPWNGDWVIAVVDPPTDRTRRGRAAAALWFDGFRAAAGAAFLRPDWPGERARGRARQHAGADGVVLAGRPVIEAARLIKLYDLDALDRAARALAGKIERQRPNPSPERCFAARMEIDGEVAQFLGHDPLLPRELWGERRGLEELLHAHERFQARMNAPAARFISGVLGCASGPTQGETMTEQDIERLFAGKAPAVRAVYDRLLQETMKAVGPFEIDPKKTSIHLTNGTAFAGAHPKKAWLDLTIRSTTALRGSRIRNQEQVSKNRWHQDVRLESPVQIDRELMKWIRHAYEVSKVARRPPK